MFENITFSKTRMKVLKLFLQDMDKRYYLRELERILDESLSPLRRQLLKLVSMGILNVEEEANLKYYSLNKNFVGLDELRKLVVGEVEIASSPSAPRNDSLAAPRNDNYRRTSLSVLTLVSIFILALSSIVLYISIKNTEIASSPSAPRNDSLAAPRNDNVRVESYNVVVNTTLPVKTQRPDEMASRNWKVFSGDVPIITNEGVSDEKRAKEL